MKLKLTALIVLMFGCATVSAMENKKTITEEVSNDFVNEVFAAEKDFTKDKKMLFTEQKGRDSSYYYRMPKENDRLAHTILQGKSFYFQGWFSSQKALVKREYTETTTPDRYSMSGTKDTLSDFKCAIDYKPLEWNYRRITLAALGVTAAVASAAWYGMKWFKKDTK